MSAGDKAKLIAEEKAAQTAKFREFKEHLALLEQGGAPMAGMILLSVTDAGIVQCMEFGNASSQALMSEVFKMHLYNKLEGVVNRVE